MIKLNKDLTIEVNVTKEVVLESTLKLLNDLKGNINLENYEDECRDIILPIADDIIPQFKGSNNYINKMIREINECLWKIDNMFDEICNGLYDKGDKFIEMYIKGEISYVDMQEQGYININGYFHSSRKFCDIDLYLSNATYYIEKIKNLI